MRKKIIIAGIILIVLLVGLIAGLILIRQRQDIRKKASTPTGTATINLSPASGTHGVGESFEVNVSFNPGGVAISAVAARLVYPYGEASPALSAATPIISSALLSTGDWTCPIKTVTAGVTGLVEIDISCINTNPDGYASSTDTPLAAITFTVNELPTNNPTSLSFAPAESIITQKSDGSDVLLTPASTGVYTLTAPTASPTASPTGSPTGSPTASPTSSPTGSPTSSPTSSPTATPTGSATVTATLPPDVPVTGLTLPTIIGLFLGFSMLTLSAFLALKN